MNTDTRKGCIEMKMKINLARKISQSVAMLAIGFVSANGMAAPGTLSDTPLYMGTGVEPNVLWIVDDSRSMDLSVLKSAGANAISAYNSYDEREDVDVTPDDQRELLESCVGYNVSAFNGEVAAAGGYTPWRRADGTYYPESTSLSEYTNPITGVSVDLSGAKYMPWNDDDDGVFEVGECYENTGVPVASNTHFVTISGDAAIRQYTNWYSYYRTRDSALKAILSEVFYEADERFGLATINRHSARSMPIAEMSVAANKTGIINRLLAASASNTSTPLKRALLDAGRYFHQSDDDAIADPNFLNPSSPVSPITENCQANYTVMVTDGYYRGDTNLDLSTDLHGVSSDDLDTDSDNSDANEYNGRSYGDNVSNTMADLAMYYYSTDLDTTRENLVRSNDDNDSNPAQHLVFHAVAFGITGLLDPKTANPSLWSASTTQSDYEAGNGWPKDIDENSASSIDDLYHATYNARGSFYSSANPQQLKDDIDTIMKGVRNDVSGTAAAVGFNSTSISAGSLLFQAWFSSEDWTGDLLAFDFADGDVVDFVDENENGTIEENEIVDEEPVWSAAELLDSRDLNANPRLLLTYSSTEDTDNNGAADGKGIVFSIEDIEDFSDQLLDPVTTNGKLNRFHLQDLLAHSNSPADSDDEEAFAQNFIEWLAGDQENETQEDEPGLFRERNSLLGDIVYSSPQYVAAPSAPYPNHIESDIAPYDAFVTANQDRTPVVYVGSNDGMLHAFKATNTDGDDGDNIDDDGKELFAYLPEMLFSSEADKGYHHLAEADYAHIPYVDGTPTTGDVYIDDAWRTYLVGGLNGGGKGIYVLDITNPDNFNAANAANIVKYEFTHPNLGYTYARPQIGKLNNGRWAAIFGNGYNNSGHGEASLFILYLDATRAEILSGTNYKEITTGVGDNEIGDCSDCNGLSSPSIVDLDGDAVIDRVYAGDVMGNMWAFDLTATTGMNPDEDGNRWKVAHGSSYDSPAPLFSAGTSKPITSKPVVVAHPDRASVSTDPNLLVLFGTGQFLAENDNITDSTQSFYGVWDTGASEAARYNLGSGDLTAQTITPGTALVGDDSIPVRNLSNNEVAYNTASTPGFGWYVDFITPRERSVLTPLVVGNYVTFVTTIPSVAACSGGGSGWLMVAELFSGAQPKISIFSDIAGITGGIELEHLSGGVVTLDNKYVGADSVGDIQVIDAKWQQERPSRRASWSIIR